MLSNVKNILVGLSAETGEQETSAAFAYGLSLASKAKARIAVQSSSVKLAIPHSYLSSFAAGLVDAENRRLEKIAQHVADDARASASLAGVICQTETPHLGYDELVARFLRQARVHDLTILDAEQATISTDRGLLEAALFDSGRPLIVVPPHVHEFVGERIAVAWDGSAKAARALHDALPFLLAAEHVDILSIQGEKDLAREVAGAEVAPQLAAHGIDVTVVGLPAVAGDAAEAIRRHAVDAGIDMLVMGAFAHSWIRQTIFGGVTRSMLDSSRIPLLLSH